MLVSEKKCVLAQRCELSIRRHTNFPYTGTHHDEYMPVYAHAHAFILPTAVHAFHEDLHTRISTHHHTLILIRYIYIYNVYIYMYVYICICICTCIEREPESQRERERERERARARENTNTQARENTNKHTHTHTTACDRQCAKGRATRYA